MDITPFDRDSTAILLAPSLAVSETKIQQPSALATAENGCPGTSTCEIAFDAGRLQFEG
jgi:hypothetical protein